MTEEITEKVEIKKAIDELKNRMDKLSGMVGKGKGEVENFTRENPLAALGVAFLTGVATGAIIAAVVSGRK